MTKAQAMAMVMGALAVGCGGTSDVTVSGDGGAIEDGSAGGDGGTNGDGATGDGATTNDGASNDGGTTGDAAPGSPDGGSPLDAGPGGNMQTVSCGNTTCVIGTQVCCVTQLQNPPPPFSYGCVSGATCPNQNQTTLGCSSTANCPMGQVCCIDQVGGGNTIVSACATQCTRNGAQLCDRNAMPTGCSMGQMCSSANIGDWGLPPTYATCGGMGN